MKLQNGSIIPYHIIIQVFFILCSIFDYIYSYSGRKISWDKVEIFTTTNIDKKDLTEHFQCMEKVKSFLLLEGINFDQNDEPVIFAKEYIDTNYICFNSIRKK